MKGYQFAHMEVWSNKGKSGAGPEPHALRKNGQRAWTAQEILDEAERIAGASEHVIPGRPGPEILPRAANSFSDMRQMQEAASQVQESYIKRSKGKGKKPVEGKRKLRVDAATLYASVFSLPIRTEDALSNPEEKRKALDALEHALDWECDRISKAGGVALAGVVHGDEEYLHIHVFAIDPVRGRVDHLHPGRVAKDAVNMSGEEKSKARGKKANMAYREAMVAWQDSLHEDVFAQAGLLRIGPGRHRWSRKEYGRAKALQNEIAGREQYLVALEAWDGAQERRQGDLDDREKEIDTRDAEVARRLAEADAKIREAEQAKRVAIALRTALDLGSRAVANRELDYREPTEECKEGLEFGPGAPQSKNGRKRLMNAVRPAYDFVVGLAKKAFNLRRREAQVASQKAENRGAAMALAKERQREGRSVPDTMAQIIHGDPLPLDRSAFPGALFVSRGGNSAKLQKTLDEMPNVSVRRAWIATWQSQAICDERPDLADELSRGVAILETTALQRGYDLETGKHDPKAAKDAKKASLHLDTEPDPIRIIKPVRQRVRIRG